MSFSFRQVRYFEAVARCGSVSLAAHSLSISQSTVTEALRDLEADLKCKLFERHARGVHLTLKGQQFLRHCHRILADVSDARDVLHDQGKADTGRIVLGVTRLIAGYLLPRLLADFAREFPGIEIVLVEDTSAHLEHMLVGGEIDVALMVLQPDARPSSLRTEVVSLSRYRVWLPIGHPAGRKGRLSLRDVAAETHIILASDELSDALLSLHRTLGTTLPAIFKTDSVEAARSLVAIRYAIAIMPDLVYRPWSLDGDKIEAHRVSENLPVTEAVIGWRRGSALSTYVQGLIDIAVALNPS
jgi:DNA-binding transcriptional LysR family regulator